MAEIMAWIMELMRTHGALSVFVGVIIESVIVPIPSPLIIMAAGALLVAPDLALQDTFFEIMFNVVLPGSIASTIGAYLTYAFAYWGGKPLIDRCHRFLGFGWDDVLTFEKRLSNHAVKMIFILRALPIVPLSLISAAAGGLRMSAWTFTWATFAGSVPRCLILAWLGHLMRDSYEGFAGQMNKMESAISGVIVLGVIALVVFLRKRMKVPDIKG
jgi:membrane protein DedA with SNARE-associated domain